jgi:hypothetical protein
MSELASYFVLVFVGMLPNEIYRPSAGPARKPLVLSAC